MRRDYTIQFHSRKWWYKLFFFTLDSSPQNAWVLYCDNKNKLYRRENYGGRLAFYMAVANSLIGPAISVPRTCNVNNVHLSTIHYIVKHPDGLRKLCRVCSKKQRRVCKACQWAACYNSPCFWNLHSQKKGIMTLIVMGSWFVFGGLCRVRAKDLCDVARINFKERWLQHQMSVVRGTQCYEFKWKIRSSKALGMRGGSWSCAPSHLSISLWWIVEQFGQLVLNALVGIGVSCKTLCGFFRFHVFDFCDWMKS